MLRTGVKELSLLRGPRNGVGSGVLSRFAAGTWGGTLKGPSHGRCHGSRRVAMKHVSRARVG